MSDTMEQARSAGPLWARRTKNGLRYFRASKLFLLVIPITIFLLALPTMIGFWVNGGATDADNAWLSTLSGPMLVSLCVGMVLEQMARRKAGF